MKNTKRFLWKTRRLFAAVFALIMVLGIVQVSALPTQAAEDGVDNVYTVRWPVGAPQDSVKIHYVDGKDNPIDVGKTNRIGLGNDPDNVKSIYSYNGNSDAGAMPGYSKVPAHYVYNLTNLVSENDNAAFEDRVYKKAYYKDSTGQPVDINPFIFAFDDEKVDGIPVFRYVKNWDLTLPDDEDPTPNYSVKDGAIFKEDEVFKTEEVVTASFPKLEGNTDITDIYLVYDKGYEDEKKPTPVTDTVSNSEIGLKMYLFDYDRMWGNDAWTGTDGGPRTDLYTQNLTTEEDGFPHYKNGNTSLIDFFNPANGMEADKLFRYNEGSGLYYYNSAENAAYYDELHKEFIVYDEIVAPYNDGNSMLRRSAFKKGNFIPFNDIDINKVLTSDDDHKPVYGAYNVDGNTGNTTDYHFGMYVTGNIFQPVNGQSINGDDMIFTISGDDDILVYIDEVLVLDLGGIHDPAEGTINFATGVVTATGARNSNLKDILLDTANNGKHPGKVNLGKTQHTLTAADFNGNTFKDNTIHTIKIFYDERGEGASNLLITLNAPKAPTLPVKDSFWLDNGKDYNTKFNKMNDNIKDAQYILEEIEDISGFDAESLKISLIDEENKTIGSSINKTTFTDGDGKYSFTLEEGKKYHLMFAGKVNGKDESYLSDEINGSENKLNLSLEGNKLTFNVQTVSYEEFTKATDNYTGDYEFGNLDYNKKYQVVQQLYTLDNQGKKAAKDGGSDKYPYEFTELLVNDTSVSTGNPASNRQGNYVVSPEISFLNENNVLQYPKLEFKNVYLEKKGSIIVTDIFKITDKDGGVTQQDDAPNKTEYNDTVKYVLYVKDRDSYKKVEVTPTYDAAKGTYTFGDLDTDKDYQVRVEATENSKHGETENAKYTGTDQDTFNVKATTAGTKVEVVNNYKEPKTEPRVPDEPKKGSIIVTDIFKITDKDGGVTQQDDAPNKDEYNRTVKYVLYEKDGDAYKKVEVTPVYDAAKGTYTFENLDTNKVYELRVEATSDSKYGEIDEARYTGTEQIVFPNIKVGDKIEVVNKYMAEPIPPTLENPEIGSIKVTDIFRIT